ncbi:RagB/SusD family nutrient uptake outer membrane protein [Marinoscillum sp.]|uniref:RagB/SusD family nutrient uptake outer membrane protein n=1 Tax=Marinoscillum sp. TaxID=2024838 RepID=UPI003BAAF543
MKNIKIYSILFLSFLVLGSCTDQLDLNPPQDIDNSIALNSDANVKTVLIGAYDALSDGDLFGGNTQRNSELLGADDELQFSGTFGDPSDIWRKEMTVINGDVADLWLDGYNTINIANNILASLEVVNEEDQALVEAESRFIRGLMYFELVLFFGPSYAEGSPSSLPGVPLVTEPNNVDPVERASVQAVYDFIIDDLEFAIANLPAENGVYANSVAAGAILSRVYLQMADYAGARDAANAALTAANGVYDLTTFAGAFNNQSNSIEDVFSIQVTTQDGVNNMQLFFAASSFGGRGDIEIQQKHLDMYEAGDVRGSFFYTDAATGDTRTSKWTDQFANVTYIRLAELYLTRAEANFREGTAIGDTPANDLNRIRGRAGLLPNLTPTLNDILMERKLELAFEGHSIHDIKRLQGTTDGFAYDANELVFPIPDRERNINPDLRQNDGYGN